MIKRVVQMTFLPEEVDAFLELFTNTKSKIRNFKGCLHLELWQNTENKNVIYTYSLWQDENSLEQYRNSQLFRDTWALTKIKFMQKPNAFSVNCIDEV